MSIKDLLGLGQDSYFGEDKDFDEVGEQAEAEAEEEAEENDTQEHFAKGFSFFGGFRTKNENEEPAGEKPETDKNATIQMKTFVPLRMADCTAILEAIETGVIVHVRLDECRDQKNPELSNTFLRIIYAMSGCAHAMKANLFRPDETKLDFFVIPKNVAYDTSGYPQQYIDDNNAEFNFH